MNAWCATAASTNCTRKSSCTEYADEALKQFEARFNHLNKPKRRGVMFMGVPVEELSGVYLDLYLEHMKEELNYLNNDKGNV